jgi:hypothetical protein
MNLILHHPARKIAVFNQVLKETITLPVPLKYFLEGVAVSALVFGAFTMIRTGSVEPPRPIQTSAKPWVGEYAVLPVYPDTARYVWSGYYRVPASPFNDLG